MNLEVKIIKIKAVGNVLLNLDFKYINKEEPIWEWGNDPWFPGDNLSLKPAAFILDKSYKSQAQLEVTLQTQNAGVKLEPGKYTLTGVYKEKSKKKEEKQKEKK